MKRMFALVVVACGIAIAVNAQENVKEPSTGKRFPVEVKFAHGEDAFALHITGIAVRKKLVFRVYGMAHYIEEPVNIEKKNVFRELLTDGKAKQITMIFARDVDRASIQDAYRDGFEENATTADSKTIQPFVDQFIGYFTNDVKEDEQFVLRWLPGGKIVAILQGDEKPPLTNALFAKTLWSFWFGEDAVVDRDDLVERIVAD